MTLNSVNPNETGNMATATATAIAIATLSTNSTEMYDLRLENDDRSASISMGATILSSAPSSPSRSLHDDRTARGMIMSLSLHPSMVDSSVLVQSETSSITSGDISLSDVSDSTLAPHVFANIGRSLMLASCASLDTSGSEDASDAPSHTSRVAEAESVKGAKWWDRLQTDEDWDDFRTKANDYLNALITEEIKELKGTGNSSGTCCSVNKAPMVTQWNNEGYSKVKIWLQGLYESINATLTGITSKQDCMKTTYVSSLLKEIVDIQQHLDILPPMPPPLPKELSLDDLPSESRDLLIQYRERLDAWRREALPEHEELKVRYAQCQEKLLAAIIDAEEELFYDKKGECNGLGTVNDDGYIEVVGKESQKWDDAGETLAISQSKCQLTLGAAFVAALTAGASFFLAMQSKRR